MNNEIIHVHIWEPHQGSIFGKNKKSDKAEIHTYTCPSKDSCDAYKNGTCINVGNVFGARCPVGKKSIGRGYSQRARAYYSTIQGWKDRHKDTYGALKSAPKRITKVSGGWMLPYSYINMDESIPFKSHGGGFSSGCPFLEDESMNKDVVSQIINQSPRAMFGDVISDYQEKEVPKFIHDFSIYYPEKFKECLGGSGRVDEILGNLDFVGRSAILKTIKSGVKVKLGTNTWEWDGEKIYTNSSSFVIFKPCTHESCYCEFFPDDEATVEITSSDQVCETTKFAD